MRTCLLLAVAFFSVSGILHAQNRESRSGLPVLIFRTDTEQLQQSLYPESYQTADVRDDIAWVRQSDSSLRAFWQTSGNSVLALLADFSGFEWRSNSIDCYLLRYYPSIGESDPMMLPLGGVRTGVLIEAAPSRAALDLNLIYQLARRLLADAANSMLEQSISPYVLRHPLLESSPYRRDLMALHLAMAVAENVMGKPFAQAAYDTPEWERFVPSRLIRTTYLQKNWPLSLSKPLSTYLMDESYESELVRVTRTTSSDAVAGDGAERDEVSPSGVPPSGKFGMAIRQEGSKLLIAALDPARSAAICGLQVNDQIVSVNDSRPATAKELIELILARYNRGGAKLSILRAGKPAAVIVRPTAAKKTDSKG